LVDVLDRDRACFDARRACRAGPELLGLGRHPMRRGLPLGLRIFQKTRPLREQLVADVEDDLLRVERLPRRERRAVVGAAPALRARIAGEELLPREVADGGRAEGLLVLDVLDERELTP